MASKTNLRSYIPIFCMIALTALFFKMPETPSILGFFKCKTCPLGDPYLPMLGGGYFATLLAISLLFPTHPHLLMARIGMAWSVLLAAALTYIDLPNICTACLVSHLCNILIWAIWSSVPTQSLMVPSSPFGERLFLTIFAPISVIALFGCLNLTFMIYNLKNKHMVLSENLSPDLPSFDAKMATGKKWWENRKDLLREFMKVSGHTVFVVGDDGEIEHVISSVSEEEQGL